MNGTIKTAALWRDQLVTFAGLIATSVNMPGKLFGDYGWEQLAERVEALQKENERLKRRLAKKGIKVEPDDAD